MNGPIEIVLQNNNNRQSVAGTTDDTPRFILERENVSYSNHTVSLDGTSLAIGDIDKTFDVLGVRSDKIYLTVVEKQGSGYTGSL